MKHRYILPAIIALGFATPALAQVYQEADADGIKNPEELSFNGIMDRIRHGQASTIDYAMGYGAAKAGMHEEAREIFRDAIQKTENPQAMTWMSWMDDNGLAGPEDAAAAAEWDRKAAELGSEVAAFNYGLDLMRGRGVPLDDEKGRRMIDQAAAMGDRTAQHLIDNDYDLDSVTPDADAARYEQKLY